MSWHFRTSKSCSRFLPFLVFHSHAMLQVCSGLPCATIVAGCARKTVQTSKNVLKTLQSPLRNAQPPIPIGKRSFWEQIFWRLSLVHTTELRFGETAIKFGEYSRDNLIRNGANQLRLRYERRIYEMNDFNSASLLQFSNRFATSLSLSAIFASINQQTLVFSKTTCVFASAVHLFKEFTN